MTKNGVAEVEPVDAPIPIHQFSTSILGEDIGYLAMKLKDCVFIWIGSSKDNAFNELCVSMMSHYDSNALSTQILEASPESRSISIAQKLSKRLKKPVYLSCNIVGDRCLAEVQKRLIQEMTDHPECF